jgi:Beta/Gamma crystallin
MTPYQPLMPNTSQLRRAVAPILFACLSILGFHAGSAQAAGCSGRVYWDSDFHGEARRLRGNASYVVDRWNDQISSIAIYSGVWRFYRDAGFEGDYLELGPGNYSFQFGDAWNDQISSVRCVRPTD